MADFFYCDSWFSFKQYFTIIMPMRVLDFFQILNYSR
jgi:hypothetical protein